uniref:Uncharacterized protein n=1 Tax=Panagrolaimus sp. PS1159 TaxID=55785 RepID=A0AC35EZK1_9BILA
MGEKSDKQKNVDNYFKSTTIDEKLEKLGISNTKNIFRGRRSLSPKNSLSNIRNSFIEATAMPDQFDDDWSSCEKNVSEEEKNVYPRRFLSPKMQYCKADLYSFSTVPVDQFDDNADWSSLEKNE